MGKQEPVRDPPLQWLSRLSWCNFPNPFNTFFSWQQSHDVINVQAAVGQGSHRVPELADRRRLLQRRPAIVVCGLFTLHAAVWKCKSLELQVSAEPYSADQPQMPPLFLDA